MSLDFLNTRKDLRKDTLNFKHLVWESNHRTGDVRYSLSNKSRLDVFYNPILNTLRVKGSLPYFIHGHNFRPTTKDVTDAILLISDMLNIDLADSEILAFENGEILETDLSIREILANHIRARGMKTRIYDNGKYFENALLFMKMYNENINMYKIPLNVRKEAARDYGYDPTRNYIKIENHYKKPEAYFKERGIKLSTLMDEDFETELKNDLLTTYQSIQKTGLIEIPTDKRNLSTPTIILLALKEMEKVYGFDSNTVIKNILKSIPNEVLSKGNKKDRRTQIKRLTEALKGSQRSIYDLSELLVATMR